ncbi:fumarylacetoacetate hydrolase family protein [Chlorogloeopsis sp. ULAP01]|uniref:fumarylacetoacetate hydrolase family protein n=1 Tax=Chlorogloeopsis sp. ULAP01 TaxID=3056483 RepID=UPI0025AAD218|nr:fumarylacetoacetate hydrolase family protein [Chlorogloeopsis sp. ULAP01]MDM9384786.1 fumarylacetoacetate hydrolase family protein [Chlorogloeopsis sp. ULAP01]
MKLVTFLPCSQPQATPTVGVVVDGDAVVSLQAGSQMMAGSSSLFFVDMLAFLDGGEAAQEAAQQVIDFVCTQRPPEITYSLSDVRLLSPVPQPRSLRDCLVFEKHLIQATRSVVGWYLPPLAKLDTWVEKLRGRSLFSPPKFWYKSPVYYKGNPFSVVGTDAKIHWPTYTQKLDYELEIGIFIGKTGRNITEATARNYIAGYTIFNDFSARDIQIQEMKCRLGPAKGKDFDTGNAIGPYLVTPDEVPQPYNLTMSAKVNGEEWSQGNSNSMHFTFEEIIAYISKDETLYPGEFIGSGTVGNGCGLELNRWLKRTDVVELEVESLGTLRNVIV